MGIRALRTGFDTGIGSDINGRRITEHYVQLVLLEMEERVLKYSTGRSIDLLPVVGSVQAQMKAIRRNGVEKSGFLHTKTAKAQECSNVGINFYYR